MPEATIPVVPAADAKPAGGLQVTGTQPAVPPVEPEPKKPEAAPERDHMAERFALLAKETRRIALEKQKLASERQQRESALKERETSLASERTKYEEWEKAQKSALSDPGSYLRRVYGDNWYDRLTQYKLEGEQAPPPELAVQAVREEAKAEIERLRKENEERWTAAETERKRAVAAAQAQAQAEQKAIIDSWQGETVDFVRANAEKYELINLNEAHDLVPKVIRETYQKTRRVMAADEAADLVEKYLEDQAAKVFAGKKWSARAAAQKPAEPSSESARTLTNGMSASSSGPAGSGSAASQDRIARAVAAMEAAIAGQK